MMCEPFCLIAIPPLRKVVGGECSAICGQREEGHMAR
jgi:hypothetical protein